MLTIQPPFGYQSLKPLNRTDYVRLLAPGEVPSFIRNSPIVPLSYSEITVAAWHYPMVFVPDTVSGGYTMAAVLGLGRNSFGRDTEANRQGWDPQAYVPAYLRRYPFCMATVSFEGRQEPDLMVCVEAFRATQTDIEGGVRLFDESGEPGEDWKQIEAFLREYEADLNGSRAFTAKLAELDLLEPFSANVVRPNGESQTISGMVRVNEARLTELDAETLAQLHRSGFLGRIYIHLYSLQRFQSLLVREVREGAVAHGNDAPATSDTALTE